MQHILITGANRGIGFAMTKAYLERGAAHIFAAARNLDGADELKALAAGNPITLVPLDINDPISIAASLETVSQHTDHLDVLVNNAGIFPHETRTQRLPDLDAAAVRSVVTTNSVSPLIVTQAYVDLLKQSTSPRVVMVSSGMGSLQRQSDARRANAYAYCMSKAALNMAACILANDLREAGIIVITVHPGWVQTDMGGSNAAITPSESAAGLVRLADRLTPEHSGGFFDYTGATVPW